MNRRVIYVLTLLLSVLIMVVNAKASRRYVPDSNFYKDELSNSYYNTAIILLDEASFTDDTREQAVLYQEVIRQYDEIIKIHPNDPIALFNRGSVYIFSGEYEKAIEDNNAFLQISPGDGLALENRGRAYELSGDIERAYQDYTTVQNELIKMEQRSPSSDGIRERIDKDLLRIGKKIEELQEALE